MALLGVLHAGGFSQGDPMSAPSRALFALNSLLSFDKGVVVPVATQQALLRLVQRAWEQAPTAQGRSLALYAARCIGGSSDGVAAVAGAGGGRDGCCAQGGLEAAAAASVKWGQSPLPGATGSAPRSSCGSQDSRPTVNSTPVAVSRRSAHRGRALPGSAPAAGSPVPWRAFPAG